MIKENTGQAVLDLTITLHGKVVDYLERHNILYWLGAESVLGSYRDFRVVPWAVDMDIEMPYSSLETLAGSCRTKLSGADDRAPARLSYLSLCVAGGRGR